MMKSQYSIKEDLIANLIEMGSIKPINQIDDLPAVFQDTVKRSVDLSKTTESQISIIPFINESRTNFFIPNSSNLSDTNSELYTKKLLNIMQDEIYTPGEIAPSESFVEDLIAIEGANYIMNWLMEVYHKYYDNPHILIGLLHMLSHFSYEIVKQYGPIMALALLQHKSLSVREFAIKAFENWNNKEYLIYLKNIKCDQSWLQDYLSDVIYDIEQN